MESLDLQARRTEASVRASRRLSHLYPAVLRTLGEIEDRIEDAERMGHHLAQPLDTPNAAEIARLRAALTRFKDGVSELIVELAKVQP